MSETDLFALVYGMKPGWCVKVTRSDLVQCASSDLHPIYDGPARDSEIAAFLQKVSENWGFTFWMDPITGGATIQRLGEAN